MGKGSLRGYGWFRHRPLDYFIEESPVYLPKLRPFFAAATAGHFQIVTSLVTLVEVLVHPLRNGRDDLARQYRDILLHSANCTMLRFSERIAEEAARLRVCHQIRTPDAIQLATAAVAGASWFLTNDAGLPALPGLSTIILDRIPVEGQTLVR